ncbi:sulfatase-like hydrolase/transferase [Pollutibacter soli]|uniref:sulfatase-like hydrolase/transferase n=1 Tax=Pollutibacter soli TaxID=3034157 RepID=UPI0030133288
MSFHQPEREAFRPPNIILIIVDDLGYSDLASYGNTRIHTPHMDALGKEGVRFTHAYVTSPICSPSRMGIMTGRYQNRFGSEYMPYDNFDPEFLKDMRSHFLPFHRKTEGMKSMKPSLTLNRKKFRSGVGEDEITLGEVLKKNGYATGLVGKWNLGDVPGSHPSDKGFDYSYFFSGALTRYVVDPVDNNRYVHVRLPWSFSDLPAWAPRSGSSAIHEGKETVIDTGYLTFSFARKGTEFIEANKNHPFFLTLSFNAPHDPFQVPKDYFDRITNEQDSVKRIYFAMIEALDDAIGTVVQKIKSAGIEENTVILFLSDNGGATYTRATDNAPLRGGKCTHFDGGLRVPFFIKYPGTVPGGQVYNHPISSLDVFSTIAGISRTPLPADRPYDGVDLMPFLKDSSRVPHEIFYWRNGYSKAVRKGDWKLYINNKNDKMFLFDMAHDEEEKHDQSVANPGKVTELMKELQLWEKEKTVKPAWPSTADVLIDVDGEIYFFPG